MANHTATKKRIRRDTKVRVDNKSKLSTMRTAIKSLRKSIDSKEKNVELFKSVQARIAKCGQNRIIHPDNASRKISRLTKLFNSI